MDTKNLTIKRCHEMFKSGEMTPSSLTAHYFEKIKEKNGEINAYLETFPDAEDAARESDKRYKEGKSLGVLDGIPIAVKDNILIEGKIATAASRILEGHRAVYDATAIKKLKAAGVVFLGRANMDEFAMGSSTETSAYGVVKNPADLTRVPGGSSGGSVAAVAGDMALAALGSDTAGSVRQPSSFCGVVGMKPTYGTISRYGLMAMGNSLDQIGPIANSVEDTEILFEAMKGADEYDSTSIEKEVKIKSKRLGVPRDFVGKGVDPDVLANFNETIARLEKAGYEIVDISLPSIKYSLSAYYIIMPAEVSTNLSRFDGMRYGKRVAGGNLLDEYMNSRGQGFGKEPRRRILLGAYVLSSGYYDAYYKKAQDVRSMIRRDFLKVMEDNNLAAIVTPTAPSPAFRLGEKGGDPLSMYLQDIFTVPANIIGVPAISVPSGFVERDGVSLPIGFQVTTTHFAEKTLFAIAKDVEGLV